MAAKIFGTKIKYTHRAINNILHFYAPILKEWTK